MSDIPSRRLADRVSSSPTFIGAASTFTGNLECRGDLVVAGTVCGDAVVRGVFTLSEGGRWEGSIKTINGVIAGEVQGSIVASEKLEVRKSARIRGIIQAPSVAVTQGALIDGEMAVTSGESVVHFKEKRGE